MALAQQLDDSSASTSSTSTTTTTDKTTTTTTTTLDGRSVSTTTTTVTTIVRKFLDWVEQPPTTPSPLASPPPSDPKKRKADSRLVYICLGLSNSWITPIHVIFKQCLALYPSLSWIRFRMSYSRFPNFADRLKQDLTTKLNATIYSTDVCDNDPCNCVGGLCVFGGLNGLTGSCRQHNVVCQLTCKTTGRRYIGNTARCFKTRLKEHISQARRLIGIDAGHRRHQQQMQAADPTYQPAPIHFNLKRLHHFSGLRASSTSLARYISATIYPNFTGDQPSTMTLRNLFTYKILWSGKTLSCCKSFGSWDCALCAREQIELISAHKFDPDRGTRPLINKSLEIHGSCPHGSIRRFHPLAQLDGNPGADNSD